MKIWNEYGSEHSMNLVMIGHFQSLEDAENTKKIIDELSVELVGKINIGTNSENFSSEIRDILRKADCYILNPGELEHFLYERNISVEGDKIILKTDETEVSAFFKLMIHKGAKVEVYSAHHYPNEQHGRGK